jgi:hypothetical protein
MTKKKSQKKKGTIVGGGVKATKRRDKDRNNNNRSKKDEEENKDKDATETESTYTRLSWWKLSNDTDINNNNNNDDDVFLASNAEKQKERSKLPWLLAAERKHKNEQLQLRRRRDAIARARARAAGKARQKNWNEQQIDVNVDADVTDNATDAHSADEIESKEGMTGKVGTDVLSSCEFKDCDTATGNDTTATSIVVDIDIDVDVDIADAESSTIDSGNDATATTTSIDARRCVKRNVVSDSLSSPLNGDSNGELSSRKKKKKRHNACTHAGGLGRIDFSGQITLSPNSQHQDEQDQKMYDKRSSRRIRKPSTRIRVIAPNIIPPTPFALAQNPFPTKTKKNTKKKPKSIMKSRKKDSVKGKDAPTSSCSSSKCSGKPSATRNLFPTDDTAPPPPTKTKSKKKKKSTSKIFHKPFEPQTTETTTEEDTDKPLKRKWNKVLQKRITMAQNLLKKNYRHFPDHEQQHSVPSTNDNSNNDNDIDKQVVIADVEHNDSVRTVSTAAETVAIDYELLKTASTTIMEEPKYVKFDPVVRVKSTLSRHDMTPNEKYIYWKSGNDDYDENITEQILARLTEEWTRKREEESKEEQLLLQLLQTKEDFDETILLMQQQQQQ